HLAAPVAKAPPLLRETLGGALEEPSVELCRGHVREDGPPRLVRRPVDRPNSGRAAGGHQHPLDVPLGLERAVPVAPDPAEGLGGPTAAVPLAPALLRPATTAPSPGARKRGRRSA